MANEIGPIGVSEEPEPPPTGFGRLRGVVNRVPNSWFGWLVAAIVLAITAGFGGLGTVNADDVTTYTAGQTYRGTPLSITVERATVTASDPALAGQNGKQALLLQTKITNTWTQPLHPASAILDSALPGILWDGKMADEVRHADGTIAPDLQPGVQTPLIWIWYVNDSQVATKLAAGEVIEFDLQDQTVREVGLVDKQLSVADPVLSARAKVTVDR